MVGRRRKHGDRSWGASAVSRATGVWRRAIAQGIKELQHPASLRKSGVTGSRRVRPPGGGRKKTVSKDPTLLRDLERLLEPVTRGDPQSPLRWTCKSVRKLAGELQRRGHQQDSPPCRHGRLVSGHSAKAPRGRRSRRGVPQSHADESGGKLFATSKSGASRTTPAPSWLYPYRGATDEPTD